MPFNRQSVVINIGFAFTGVATTLLGPIIPVLSSRWLLNDAQAGYLFTGQFVGSMIGVALNSRFALRFGYVRWLVAGYALMCAGVAGLGISNFHRGILCVFGYGVGLGITIPTTNLFVSSLNPRRRAASLNLLNFCWTAGAVMSPPVIALSVKTGSTTLALSSLALALAVGALALGLLRVEGVEDPFASRAASALETHSYWRSPFVSLIGAMCFLYVGTETAIAGWVGSYALRMHTSARSLWSLAPSTFWATLMLGRLVAPVMLRHIGEDRLVLIGLIAASCGTSIILLSATIVGLVAGVSLAGAGLASVFPTTIALLSDRFGEMASRVGGLVFALAGLGGATLPGFVGWMSAHFGSLRAGLGVPLVCSLGMLGLEIVIIRTLNRRHNG
jgi:FHS family glucose/mannose:H+ symporter-like MFS transporter